MQAIKITIPGKFYDSHIYSADLFLWHEFGEYILKISWDEFLNWILERHVQPELRFVTACALAKNDLLYDTYWKHLLDNPLMRQQIRANFEELSKMPINLTNLNDLNVGRQKLQRELPFPHSDTLYFHDKLFVGDRDGLYKASKMCRTAEKIWDGSALNLAGRNWSVAVAAGTDGLFEAPFERGQSQRKFEIKSPKQQFQQSTNKVGWMYFSLYGSDYHDGFLADYKAYREKNDRKHPIKRELLKQSSVNQLFSSDGGDYSWGVHDKLCRIQSNSLDIIQYRPSKGKRLNTLSGVQLQISPDFGEIVSANSAPFGYVIEYDEGLLIVTSDGKQHLLPGEPINWRVFPNAVHYSNHLHVIYDEALVIYSFYQDYFVDDQENKHIGIRSDDLQKNSLF